MNLSKITRLWVSVSLGLTLLMSGGNLSAQESEESRPAGQFLSLTSPIDGEDYAKVSRWALKLQDQARREKRPVFLVLQIPDGAS